MRQKPFLPNGPTDDRERRKQLVHRIDNATGQELKLVIQNEGLMTEEEMIRFWQDYDRTQEGMETWHPSLEAFFCSLDETSSILRILRAIVRMLLMGEADCYTRAKEQIQATARAAYITSGASEQLQKTIRNLRS